MSKLYNFFMCGFPYEADVLYLKLLEGYEHTKRFYAVETDRTFQGNAKPLCWGEIFAEPRFRRFADKITYDAVSSAELGFIPVTAQAGARHNEHAQRDWHYQQHKDEIAEDDIILVSDADELLGGGDIPRIMGAFESLGNLKGAHIPLLRSTYDYDYIDERRGYWPIIALRKKVLDEFYRGSLTAARETFYRQIRVPSMLAIAPPVRYETKIPEHLIEELIGKAVKQYGFFGSLRDMSNRHAARLLVDPRLAGYYGWHFSYCLPNPIDIFRKVRTLAWSGVGKAENIAHDLVMANRRLAGRVAYTAPKPFLVQWPLNVRLFPKELVHNQEYYLTHAKEKLAALTAEQIMKALEE